MTDERNLIGAMQRAYGILWLDASGSRYANEARSTLAGILTSDEKIAGVMWASANVPRTPVERV